MSDTNTKAIRLSEIANQDEHGLVCRKCHCREFFVVYTRPVVDGIRRRRECRNCGWRIVTTERGG
jgi:hypothetical protein